jgi:hypothetical protein
MPIKKWLKKALQILSWADIIQWTLTGGAWVVVAVLEKLINAPVWFYATLITITVVFGIISITNIVYKYKRWLRVSYIEDPQISNILGTLRKIHERTVELTRNIDVNEFIKNSKWERVGNSILDIWDIPTDNVISLIKKRKMNLPCKSSA